MLKRLFVLACGLALFPISNATGEEQFDVLVMHGSTLVRVTGDGNGGTSEVTIREDPTPPAPEIVWEPPEVRAEPVGVVIQIFQAAPRPIYGWGFRHGHPGFVRHGKRDHGLPRAMTPGHRNADRLVRHGSRRSESGAL